MDDDNWAIDSIKERLEKAKENLDSVDKSIKKITSRETTFRSFSSTAAPLRSRNSRLNRIRHTNGSSKSRRMHPVSSDDDDDDPPVKTKKSVHSSIVADEDALKPERDSKNKLMKDEQSKSRAKRMFGFLMGTLQSFNDDATHDKVVAERRRELESKVEKAAVQEKREANEMKRKLYQDRDEVTKEIHDLEREMERVSQMREWEQMMKHQSNHIRTTTHPPIFFRPAIFCDDTNRLRERTRIEIKAMISERQREMQLVSNTADGKSFKVDQSSEKPRICSQVLKNNNSRYRRRFDERERESKLPSYSRTVVKSESESSSSSSDESSSSSSSSSSEEQSTAEDKKLKSPVEMKSPCEQQVSKEVVEREMDSISSKNESELIDITVKNEEIELISNDSKKSEEDIQPNEEDKQDVNDKIDNQESQLSNQVESDDPNDIDIDKLKNEALMTLKTRPSCDAEIEVISEKCEKTDEKPKESPIDEIVKLVTSPDSNIRKSPSPIPMAINRNRSRSLSVDKLPPAEPAPEKSKSPSPKPRPIEKRSSKPTPAQTEKPAYKPHDRSQSDRSRGRSRDRSPVRSHDRSRGRSKDRHRRPSPRRYYRRSSRSRSSHRYRSTRRYRRRSSTSSSSDSSYTSSGSSSYDSSSATSTSSSDNKHSSKYRRPPPKSSRR